MAAPTYIWEYKYSLFGLGPPVKTTLEATSSLETKVGTLVFMSSGQVDNAGDTRPSLLGLAAEATSEAATATDPIQVWILRPGDVIKGTADADASGLSGFNGKKADLNSAGDLDVADTSAGCLSVLRTEDSGLTVFCTITEFDYACVN